jgi:hypothetical protein
MSARRIGFQIGDAVFTASLRDTPAATAVWEALPLEAVFATWGEEIYFATPITVPPSDVDAETVELGDVGFWPPGQALCLFYGRTPNSAPGEIRPASPVAVVGRLEGDPLALEQVRDRTVRVTRLAAQPSAPCPAPPSRP